MFGTYPRETKIRAGSSSSEGHISLHLDFDKDRYTPGPVGDWLQKKGWTPVGTHPDTDEDLWQHTLTKGYPTGYLTWEQAVAYEMFLFMNLGPSS